MFLTHPPAPSFDFEEMQNQSLDAWRQDAVNRALASIDAKGKQAQYSSEGENVAGMSNVLLILSVSGDNDLSPSLFAALHILIEATQTLGSHLLRRLPPSQGSSLLSTFVDAYCDKLKSSIETLSETSQRQMYFDVLFLSDLAVENAFLQECLKGLLEKVRRSIKSFLQADNAACEQNPDLASSEADIKERTSTQTKRMQNILAPLLPSNRQPPDSTRLLQLGAPPSAPKQVSNGVTLVKPGPRFALLPVQQL